MLLFAFALSAVAGSAAADTTSYVVLNHGRPAGEMLVVAEADSIVVKYHHVDRQRGPRSETRYRVVGTRVIEGRTWQLPLYGPAPSPWPEPSDAFEVARDSVFWQTRDARRGVPRTDSAFYRLRSNTAYDVALLARQLLARPNRAAALLPSGTARVDIVADTTIGTGRTRQRLRLAMVYLGTFPVPTGAWLDARNELVAGQIGWFITVRRGSEALLPALRAIELRWRNREAETLARSLAQPASPAIAIVNGDVFDSDRGLVLLRHTVLVRGDRIAAVGPADSVAIPDGARVVDATGKTVIPGMADMHVHLQHTSQSTGGLAYLANGITTVRDMASDIDVAVSHRDRAARGTILSPRVILGGFIEGPGRWAGPTEVIVSTEDEARRWVARYDSLGYRQIKLYNLVQQDLVPAIADETRRRGMRLSGHVPRGLSTPAAVRLGFDEINHAAFLFSTFFPDSLYTPVMRAYSGVSQIVAPHVDVDGAEVTAMIDLFRERGTAVDGTWNLWLSSRGAAASSSLGIPNSATEDLARKSDENYMRMLRRLFDAGVPILPGTDGSSYNVELELYERSGIPAAQVLQIATIVPARVMKEDADFGSIAPGKVADLAIVAGKPHERIEDLRKVEQVMRAGILYETARLRAVATGNR